MFLPAPPDWDYAASISWSDGHLGAICRYCVLRKVTEEAVLAGKAGTYGRKLSRLCRGFLRSRRTPPCRLKYVPDCDWNVKLSSEGVLPISALLHEHSAPLQIKGKGNTKMRYRGRGHLLRPPSI